MKSYLTIFTSLILFTIVIFAIGCEPEAAVEAEKPITLLPEQIEPAPEPALAEIVDTGIAVTVNGVDITESEIKEKIRPQIERLAQQAAKMPPNYLDQYKNQMRGRALEAMIVEMLLDGKVKANNIIVTDEDADARLTQMATQQGITIEDLEALTEARGQSLDETKQRIKKGMRYQRLVEAQFGDEANITEEDAQKYYSENKGKFETPERVKASHILLKTQSADPNADPEQVKQQALAKVQDLLIQIKQGADFVTLAKEHSEGPSAPKGGDLGFFGAGQMVKPFEQAAFALKVGQVSDIVETRFGYHIIKLTDREEAIVTLFEEAKDDIIAQLENQKKGEFARQYLESLKAEANIVYPPGKEPAPKPMIPPRPGQGRRPVPAPPKP